MRNFKGGLLVKAPNWKQVKSPSRVERINKARDIHQMYRCVAVGENKPQLHATLGESHFFSSSSLR